jgi:predicted glycoside hydrolase/deacetylase ChbG (UPF0249 family)
MVRWPAAVQAANYARSQQSFSVGLHVDLGEWIFRNGDWAVIYEVVRTADAEAVRDEVERQLDTFRRLMRQEPSHMDSHQHMHRKEPVHTILRSIADSLNIPCRGYSTVRYRGDFYGQTRTGDPFHQAISVEALVKLLAELPPGVTELGCHPGFGSELNTMYTREREQEVRALCDVRVREVIDREKIVLCSFNEWYAKEGMNA